MDIIKAVQDWSSVISAILSLSVVGILVTIVREKFSINEERLKLVKEENEKLKQDVKKVGAFLGVEEFKDKPAGVNIRDIGDNFEGKIAGRSEERRGGRGNRWGGEAEDGWDMVGEGGGGGKRYVDIV